LPELFPAAPEDRPTCGTRSGTGQLPSMAKKADSKMCGIAGFIDKKARLDPERYASLVATMGEAIAHRGPDGSGTWVDKPCGVAFANRRLAVIDLSSKAAQPMRSSCGRFVLTYNGEIYNAARLRAELRNRGRKFRGHSDTEVLVEACASWGVQHALREIEGMFAFALWDTTDRVLYLARDRFGIKPLYWADFDDSFLFGSELKALRAFPGWKPEILPEAVPAFFRHSYVPGPYSIYRGVRKLEPGTVLRLEKGDVSITRYWDLGAHVTAKPDRSNATHEEILRDLEATLRKTVEQQLQSDVPIGILLSGGLDSTVLSALARDHGKQAPQTFSLGFSDPAYDETSFAEEVAKALGTQHHSLQLSDADLIDVIPRLGTTFDEPFADSSQIPTYVLCAKVRDAVTVALSGEGGDELFAGYDRYSLGRLNAMIDAMPASVRKLLAASLETLSPATWNRLAGLLPARWRGLSMSARAYFLANLLRDNASNGYRKLVGHWQQPGEVIPDVEELASPVWYEGFPLPGMDRLKSMQVIDMLTYLPDDLLVKVDRASMASSLEVRVPFLDSRLVEQVMRSPTLLPDSRHAGKWPMRAIAQKYVPKELLERPKKGFSCPVGAWLRGPLRDWAEDLLDERNLRQDGLLDPKPIRRKWAQHVNGDADWHYHLWIVLQFVNWRRAHSV